MGRAMNQRRGSWGVCKIVSPLTNESYGEWVSRIKKKNTRGSWASFGDQAYMGKDQKGLRNGGPKVEGRGEWG